MSACRFVSPIFIALAMSMLTSCDKPAPKKTARKNLSDVVTLLQVRVGSIWGGGYTVDVVPDDYVVVEHQNCPDAKNPRAPNAEAKGLCVFRLTSAQSRRFEKAMSAFKRYAVPLQSVSLDDPWVRPDGKPCKHTVTDSRLITLTWTGSDGAKLATFYTGCDGDELGPFYRSALGVTDALPIGQLISDVEPYRRNP
jgi:hypothetical protein